MSKREWKIDRRKFLKTAQVGLGATSLGAIGGLGGLVLPKVLGIDPERRYLINCVVSGGIDGFYNCSAYGKTELHGSPGFRFDSSTGEVYERVTPSSKETLLFTERYHENDLFRHPYDTDYWLGPGMKLFSNDNLRQMAIVNGLDVPGGHIDGNYILNGGALSPYSACYSSLIAAKLGAERLLALPYVQAASSGGLFTRFGTSPEPLGIPVCIPNRAAWLALTTPSPSELPNDRRIYVKNAIEAIGGSLAATPSIMSQTKRVIYGFLDSFKNSEIISTSRWAVSADFTTIFNKYQAAPGPALALLLSSHPMLNDRMQPSQFIKNRAGWDGTVTRIAYGFALAEFLILNDLSAVVDIPGIGGDWHNYNYEQFTLQTITFSMLKVLMDSLSSKLVGTTGKNFLDLTTIVMHTEFTRDPALTAVIPNLPKGSDHGRTATVLLAGAGIKGGKIYGGDKRGPDGKWGNFTDFQFREPLPIDPANGRPHLSGKMIGQHSLFPTMLYLFGIEIPPEQKTEWDPMRFLLS